jgi:hypothetical protein
VIHHIDVSVVLRRTVCDLYSNLVTRPTGVAVRREIQLALAQLPDPCLTIIDFSHVGLLDFSCADEVVGKLLDEVRRDPARRETFVLVRGVHDTHLEAIETVLERYDIAVIVEDSDGASHIAGPLADRDRRACAELTRLGRARPADLAPELGEEEDALTNTLVGLWERRLVMRDSDMFVALQQVQ